MAYTFLKAMGYEIGESILDPEGIDAAKSAMEKAKQRNIPLLLPEDIVVANRFAADADTKVVPANVSNPAGWCVDIGPKPSKNSAMKFAKPERSYGMDLWAYSK